MPQALYRKWRPQLWDEVVGQDHVVQTLRNALRGGRIAHAYLFSGPRGCGKTTSARLIAKALNCLHPDPAERPDNSCEHCVAVNEGRFLDLIEIDGASNNGVENIRELRDKINFAPSSGRYKIYIIDEVHMLSLGAFNALLKTLEEPPSHAVFILATTENYKIPATVTSRCQRFEFRRIPVVEIVSRLKAMCELEGLQVEEAALEVVARQATGALRDAISLLDQLVSASDSVTLAQAQALLGTAVGQTVQSLADALATNDSATALNVLSAALDAGADPRQIARQMVEHLRNLMLVRMGNANLVEATADVRALMARQAQNLDLPVLLRAVRAFNAAANDAKGGWQPQLPLELAIVESTAPLPVIATSADTSSVSIAPTGGVSPTLSSSARSVNETSTMHPNVGGMPNATPTRANSRSTPKPPPPPAADPAVKSDLKVLWARLVETVKKRSHPTAGLLNSCRPIAFNGQELVLGGNEFVCDKINNSKEDRQLIHKALSDLTGTPCVVRCQVISHKRSAGDVPKDSLVATALDLGGELIEE